MIPSLIARRAIATTFFPTGLKETFWATAAVRFLKNPSFGTQTPGFLPPRIPRIKTPV